jgi:hypothetical protein
LDIYLSLIHIQFKAILIFLSLFVLQILTGVCAQEQANHKEHDLHKEATAATSADNEDMKSAQVQQEGPTKDTHNLAQPQGMLAKIRFEGDLDQPLDYDEVSEMIEKNGAGDALDEINQLDDYIEEEIDQTLDIGPPPQELEPFVEEIEPAVSDTESSKKPAINSMTARASGSPVNSMEATATVSIGQGTILQCYIVISFGKLTNVVLFCVCNKLPCHLM